LIVSGVLRLWPIVDIHELNTVRDQSVPDKEGLAFLDTGFPCCNDDAELDLETSAFPELLPWWRGDISDPAIMRLNQTSQNREWFT
jgi:hypothetical protein